MSNENQKHENKQENEQPATTPAAQMELSDEQLGQVVGGVIILVEHPSPPSNGAVDAF